MLPPPKRIPPRGPLQRTAQQRVLAQWRGADSPRSKSPRPLRPPGGRRPAQGAVRLPSNKSAGEVEIVKVWNNLIDPTIVAHAQPVGLSKGTLFVNVDNNVWLSEIVRYRRKEILDRLQHSFGREIIARISFRIG